MKKMSKLIAMVLILIILAGSVTGCGTTSPPPPKYTTPVRYSFAQEGQETATITFVRIHGGNSDEEVYFVALNDVELPTPEKGTHWESTIVVPAGVPLNLNAYVVRDRFMTEFNFGGMDLSGISGEAGIGIVLLLPVILVVLIGFVIIVVPIDAIAANVEDRFKYVVFECPPLTAGERYELKFNYRAIIQDELILTRVWTEQQRGLFRTKDVRKEERIRVQRFQATRGEKDETRSFSHFFPSVIHETE